MKRKFISLILSSGMLISTSCVVAEDSRAYEFMSENLSEPTPEPTTQDLRDWQLQVEKKQLKRIRIIFSLHGTCHA